MGTSLVPGPLVFLYFHIFWFFLTLCASLYHQVTLAEANGNVMLSIVQLNEEWAHPSGKQQAKSIKGYQRLSKSISILFKQPLCPCFVDLRFDQVALTSCMSLARVKMYTVSLEELATSSCMQSFPQRPTGRRERVAGRDEHVERQRPKHDQGPGQFVSGCIKMFDCSRKLGMKLYYVVLSVLTRAKMYCRF